VTGGEGRRGTARVAAGLARGGGRVIVVWGIDVVALALAAWALPGLELDGWAASIAAVAAIGLLNALARPALLLLALPLTVLTFGTWSLVLSAASVVTAAAIVPGFTVSTWTAGLAAPVAVAAVNAWATATLRLHDDDALFRRLAAHLAARRTGTGVRSIG
jgi:putative membrane protein